ncbi:PREDICTED: probable LRR receptor-like serine/threonine-protein kinase At3g47570 [Camelina sativa]|uniref:Probable LRR receptor-like serine/threonine-protein kinase At3g47570 n=1 Tax=Camelina sativa TaxID=90675 RepID=A0ABM1QFI0_CAMSA|nr:PREDICTED: probable LRR receptor-like serine/threonine-protein kinase At3g47570 [Camelina sativa]
MIKLFVILSFSALLLLEACGFTDETDRQALLEFKSQVSEGKRFVLSSWNHSFPLCNWKGVRCGHKHGRVTGLDVGGLQLGGVISPSIGNLSFLVSLNLSDNSFGGTIPLEVGNLFRLRHLFVRSNALRGEIPTSLSNCSRLLELYLDFNHLEEGVPWELGSLTKLVTLNFGGNNIKGTLPSSLGNLTSLRNLVFGVNNIEGAFPPAIYNLSSLEFLNIFENGFAGSLKHDFGTLLPNLQEIYMGKNYITGSIPTTLSNISNLRALRMEYNSLTGSIPPSFGKVRNLQHLGLDVNYFGSGYFGDLEFLDALINCTQLQEVDVGDNRLAGELPTSIVNLSANVIYLSLQKNLISGSIPRDIGNLIRLQTLWLAQNLLTGPLPNSLGKLSDLGAIVLYSNRMSGEIPPSIGNLTMLEILYLYNNSFEGMVPFRLGNCRHLLDLRIGYNKLNGAIPKEIMQIPTLVRLSMGGQLPQTLGKCLSMEAIYLQGNSFNGAIPDVSGLMGVQRVDLSNNNLSGSIPRYFANFSLLEYLNLSINNFEGRVPSEGNFLNATKVSISGNKNLCGGIREFQLKPCLVQAPPLDIKHSSHVKKVAIGVSLGIALLLLLSVSLFSLCWFNKRKKNQQTNNTTPSTLDIFHETISYGDLRNATNGFASSNMVGSGSFGTVFKALLPAENKVVAVKVLNLKRHGAMRSFMAECKSLKDIKHRNLVKLLTACSSIDFQGNEFRALIYEFMPNGSLDMWLHPEEMEEIRRPSRTLTLIERLNIAVDVASVLDYLHVHCHEPIAHCDVKPSNILLDDDLTAHVSDFGLARLLLKFDQESFFNQLSSAGVRGTIGYAAPEYGMGGQPSIHGDVYSFGVLLLEMFTGKRPTNELFGGNFTLNNYTKLALPEKVLDIVDKSILHSGLRVGFLVAECLTLIFEVGLRCCEESPVNRLAASEAAKELISIRERFFKTNRR